MKILFLTRMPFLSCIIFILLFSELGYSQEAEIEKFPSRPITFIVPLPPGGESDLAVRLITKEAEKYLRQPIVVVNKPGAAMGIGTAAIASANPDGYTIGNTGGPSLYFNPLLEKVPYHPIKDLQMIIQFGSSNFGVIVKADSPFKSFKDLIDFARQNPRKLTYGTTGRKNLQHYTMQRIAKKEGIQIINIPFKGTTEAQTALLGGHIQFAVGDFSYSLVEAGQMRLLMLMKEEPSPDYPRTPILKDFGYDYPYPMFKGIFGPKGIPEGIVKKLEEAFAKAMKEPGFIKGMKELRLPILYRGSKELSDYLARNYEAFSKLLKEEGLIE